MKGSWKIARFAGIDVGIHWTFGLLIAFVVFSAIGRGGGIGAAVVETTFVALAFACVVLHEFGHALAARRYGIPTRGITLFPIGGVASLARIPRNPHQELVIALAGPAVNLVIALLLFPLLMVFAGFQSITTLDVFGGQMVMRLFAFNLIMIVFNMLPAFPMDGGRVLRAFLARRKPYLEATQQAVGVGQVMAVLFMAVSFFWNPFLLLIGLFVWTAGKAELWQLQQEARWQAGLANRPAGSTPGWPGETVVMAEPVAPESSGMPAGKGRVVMRMGPGGPYPNGAYLVIVEP